MMMQVDALGESCLVWRLGDGPNQKASARVRLIRECLEHARETEQITAHDIVPAYDSLAVYFDPLQTDAAELRTAVAGLIESAHLDKAQAITQAPPPAEPTCLSVSYGGADLERVAAHTGLPETEVVRRHTEPVYTIAAIGFLPHFPYLLGLDPALATPRLSAPRPRVAAGSVAIGNDQTGVYPQQSPGGWNLLGHTDPNALLKLKTGDQIRFQDADA